MSKLLSAELARLRKSRLFWLTAAGMLLGEIYVLQFGARVNQASHVPLEQYYYYLAPTVGIFFAVWISIFLGTEYSDGTMRNKLIAGHTRGDIYLSYYLTALTGGVIMEAGWFLGGLTGIPLFGPFAFDGRALTVMFATILLFTASLTALL